jgi:hypothetical protein
MLFCLKGRCASSSTMLLSFDEFFKSIHMKCLSFNFLNFFNASTHIIASCVQFSQVIKTRNRLFRRSKFSKASGFSKVCGELNRWRKCALRPRFKLKPQRCNLGRGKIPIRGCAGTCSRLNDRTGEAATLSAFAGWGGVEPPCSLS